MNSVILSCLILLCGMLWLLIQRQHWRLHLGAETWSFTNAVGRAGGWHLDHHTALLPTTVRGQWARQPIWPPVMRRQAPPDPWRIGNGNVITITMSGAWTNTWIWATNVTVTNLVFYGTLSVTNTLFRNITKE